MILNRHPVRWHASRKCTITVTSFGRRVCHGHMPTGQRAQHVRTSTYTVFRSVSLVRNSRARVEDRGRGRGEVNFFPRPATAFITLSPPKLILVLEGRRSDGFLISRHRRPSRFSRILAQTCDSARHSSNSRLLVPPLPSFRFRCLTSPSPPPGYPMTQLEQRGRFYDATRKNPSVWAGGGGGEFVRTEFSRR